ncbi:MAG: hypothetical protein A3K53_12660 [Deltaproteobacteria bacterium RIFOXYB2_FULL_66_7]|nr:MAG: hypothetical protein A3K53_12660 [Deltaproteobacteria bacterium RIFOXYB2_FULL_66_7]
MVHRTRRWLIWLLMLAMFLSGMGIGIGGTLIVVRNRILDAFHHPEKAPKQIADRLRNKLSLTEAQASRVEAILQAHQVELRKIRRVAQPQVEAQLDQVEQEIDQMLDAGQQAKWHEMMSSLREVWIPTRPE